MEVDILNKNPRLRNRANGELGDALDTMQGNCRPTRPTKVIEQSFNSTKIRPSILIPEILKRVNRVATSSIPNEKSTIISVQLSRLVSFVVPEMLQHSMASIHIFTQ